MKKKIEMLSPQVMRLPWCAQRSGPDCGLYLMRYMEYYMGKGEGK